MALAPSPASALPASFTGHGTFIYDVPATVSDYGDLDGVVKAMQDAGMSHAWVRIHGTSAYPSSKKVAIANFIAALQAGGIAVAGWGWNQGISPKAESKLALDELAHFGLADYIADIENGHNNSKWTEAEIADYCQRVRDGVPGGFGITTFPLVDWHDPQLMVAALPFVDMFNPQVYWFGFPNKKMVKQFKRPDGSAYGTDDPVEYAALCIDRWKALMGGTPKKLVVTGQAYWSEGGISRETAEAKLDAFLAGFGWWAEIVGLNWWHFGGGDAMSHHMLAAIEAADLASKPYAT